MKLPRRQFLCLAAGAAALPVISRAVRAQTYPTKPITLVVPFPAGGGTDVIARIIAERMRGALGQAIIIENATGANGSIGVGRVARSASDGYTVVIGSWSTHVSNGALYPLQYDLLKDFEPISPITTQPFLIVTRKTFPANELKALVDWLKANPDKATAGTRVRAARPTWPLWPFRTRSALACGLCPIEAALPRFRPSWQDRLT